MTADQQSRSGLLLGLGAYLIWGFLPLYFKALAGVSATEIVAHRIVWSLVFLAGLVALWKRWPALRAAASSRVLLILVVTAALIATNWLIWIWAVTNNHVLEGSLGYYLNPLVNVLLGVVLLGERLSRARIFAVLLAAAGVAVLAFGAGDGLWISLSLAGSFALYGYVRKVAPVEAIEGLTIETAILMPISLGWILWLNASGEAGSDMARSRHFCWCWPAPSPRCPAAVHGRVQKTALFDARLSPIYRPVHPIPARGSGFRRAADDRAHHLLRRDLDGARHLRGRRLAAEPGRSRRGQAAPRLSLALRPERGHNPIMLNLVSIVIGIMCLVAAALAFLPLLGWMNWLIIPGAVIGLGIGVLSKRRSGTNLNIAVILICALRLMLGGGIF
jgi:RarD protein